MKQTVSAKVYSQEGNSPDWEIKHQIVFNYKEVKLKLLKGKLGSSYPLKKA